ncbi:MAG TPA: hypothetical protein VFZ16_19910 [Hyphomicrobiaceae bacterium]|nr:hypothetical protein [Hyphomicrobiaceae bacterium]
MLTHTAPHFTPAQLIDAGRRAETQGRPDLAVRFYRYLTDHFAEAPETAVAHAALGRISAAQLLPQAARPPPPGAPRTLRHRAVVHRDRYRSSRVLTVIVGLLGWLWAAGGAATFPAYLLLRAEAAAAWPRAEVVLPMAGGAGGSVVLGLGIVLVARIARALLDQANDVHHLLALERARLGLD